MSEILKIMTYNIQVAMPSHGIRHYVMHSWHHFFPHPRRNHNLKSIANVIRPFDIVALQELDAGSIRSRYVNQVDFLAEVAAFPFAEQQTTRNFGPFARHSKGLLSRYPIHNAQHYLLPSAVPGRGTATFCIGSKETPLFILNVHLSLGARAQAEQLAFLGDLIQQYEHVIVMGDFNMSAEQLQSLDVFKNRLYLATDDALTYPSWKPKKQLDYILLSPSLKVQHAGVMHLPYSDHLPLFAEIILPDGFVL